MNQEAELELLTNELHRDPPTILMEDIKPNMNAADHDLALQEIMRVLRGEE